MSSPTALALFEEAREELRNAIDREIPLDKEKKAFRSVLDIITSSFAPASTSGGRHGGFEGGLTCHTRDVWSLASRMAAQSVDVFLPRIQTASRGGSEYDREDLETGMAGVSQASVLKVCIIHDLNKVSTFDGKPHYIPNAGVKKVGAKLWKVNPDSEVSPTIKRSLAEIGMEDHPVIGLLSGKSVQIRDGQVSLATAYAMVPELKGMLSEEEEFAVVYHDGAFVSLRDGLMSKNSALQIILHAADMIASRFFC